MSKKPRNKAVIFGIEGETLTEEEISFFSEHQPVGYILFQRNCKTPEQIKQLTQKLKEIAGTDKLLILIDQEGGRVARLKPPHWQEFPPAAELAANAESIKGMEIAKQRVYENGLTIAHILNNLGITVNCAPLADIPVAGSHDIIGDRAYGNNAEQVSILAREMSRGLEEGGILPVLKHIPGHGRAKVDSHEDLPIVDTNLEELRKTDFVPFKRLNDIALGMTAHIIYSDIDKNLPATLSPKVITLIREEIGFKGLLMSDDISMKALHKNKMYGNLEEISRQLLNAGCDIILHCNGKMSEMQKIANICPPLTDAAQRRLTDAWKTISRR